jgi:tetratricopeptide (TPR) repeat protein
MRFRIALLLFIAIQANAQELTYKSVDSITYNQFVTHQYSQLLTTGKAALVQHIDFYYLRMRLGIAYYEKENYENALPHFRKANAMNPMDTITQEYLYYTYLFSGREEEANLFADKFSFAMQNKIHYKKKSIDMIAIGTGFSLTNNISDNQNKNIVGTENIYGQAMYQGGISYGNFYLQHTLFNHRKFPDFQVGVCA